VSSVTHPGLDGFMPFGWCGGAVARQADPARPPGTAQRVGQL